MIPCAYSDRESHKARDGAARPARRPHFLALLFSLSVTDVASPWAANMTALAAIVVNDSTAN